MEKITLPLSAEDARSLRAGDSVLLSGSVYTARDAAHQRLMKLLSENQPLPVDLRGETIYYVGPTPARPGHAVGSAGPTTSSRMDAYTPSLLAVGLRAMVGKGVRSDAVIQSMREHGAVYFGATGGAAALIAKSIVKAEVICYPDLGTEAIHRFEIVDFPAVVLIDAHGGNLYEIGPGMYRE